MISLTPTEVFRPGLEAMSENNIQLLERALRWSSKLVQGLSHLDFSDRRQILTIYSVSLRTERTDLILVCKALNKATVIRLRA